MIKKVNYLLCLSLIIVSCHKESAHPGGNNTGGGNTTGGNPTGGSNPGGNNGGTQPPAGQDKWWKPVAGTSFDWDLDDVTDKDTFTGDVVDIDAFTTPKAIVDKLHAQGKKVIAYLSVGTLENDRPDANLLPPEVIGKVYPEWPDERFVDIRQIDKLKPWLTSRFNMIAAKGFDGIEPDNVDSYSNKPGFDITLADAEKYIDYLITTAHGYGLSIGQKNISEITKDYAVKFDWALTEDAFQQGWQNDMSPYIALKKPVFTVEYTDETSQSTFDTKVCPAAKKIGFTAILKKRDLSPWVSKCN